MVVWKLRDAQNRPGLLGEKENEAGKMYILPMFPYPSGDLHLGHLRVYTISDVLARFRRMQGYNVIHPIGWDAFGLPAENAAIERGVDPASWTKSNIKKMKTQLAAMNGSWDWDREFATCDPEFYKHTQRLFLLLHEHGLAYQAESMVNYDPVDKTVLANEQVDTNGFSWRSGAKVEKRLLKQWFLKISEFREALLKDLEYLAKDAAWPERVLTMQKNWLGKSTGARIQFPVNAGDQISQRYEDIEVFTTRPDTLFGVQYVALASTHPIVHELAKTDMELRAFLDTMPSLPADSKAGYLLPLIRAVNPLSYDPSTPDATKALLPIYVAPYVLGDYGNGAVMGVPGHDARDHAFWKHNRHDEPIRSVISPSPGGTTVVAENQPFVHHGYLTLDSGQFAGQSTAEATNKIVTLLESANKGSFANTWRLRDWLISRQRYWGTPIPIIHCESCGAVPVPEDQLPVTLPSVEGHWMKRKTGNPLAEAHEWVNTSCPKCHGPAKRDTDTMDTFVDSSWYFMRFLDPKNEYMPFSSNIADEFLPVDIYIGGVEHAILHLLYARFISKFIANTELWDSSNRGEPFKKVLTQGMVHGKTYSDPSTGRFLRPNEVDLSVPSKPVMISTGEAASISFEKMSKSKYNGVDPSVCMEKYGADATRAHILFQAPISEILEWDEEKISGVTRWLKRVYELIAPRRIDWWELEEGGYKSAREYFFDAGELQDDLRKGMLKPAPGFPPEGSPDTATFEKVLAAEMKLWRSVQSTISSVSESYGETFSLNTVVSDLMALTNAIIEADKFEITDPKLLGIRMGFQLSLQKQALHALIQMMAPITPAFSEECWQLLHPHGRRYIMNFKPGGVVDTILSFFYPSPYTKDQQSGELIRLGRGIQFGFRLGGSKIASVFDFPFPKQDGTLPMLSSGTQKCAIQINGKMKFVVEIGIPPSEMNGNELEEWLIREISKTEEGKTKLTGKSDVTKAKKVIVVRGGRTINFVL